MTFGRGLQVRAVGRVADAQPEVNDKCLRGLMTLIASSRADKVVGQAIIVVRQVQTTGRRRGEP